MYVNMNLTAASYASAVHSNSTKLYKKDRKKSSYHANDIVRYNVNSDRSMNEITCN